MTSLTQFFPARDLFFKDFFEELPVKKDDFWTPRVDVLEDAKNYTIKADIPGIDQKDIKVTLDKHILTISGERKQELDEKKEGFHRIERSYGIFTRRIQLQAEVNSDKIEAKYVQGVLEITVPKLEVRQQKEIPIKVV